MSIASQASAPIRHADRFFIGGQWVAPSSDATINVIDPGTEELYFTVAEAQAADIARAVGAAAGSVRQRPVAAADARASGPSTCARSRPRSARRATTSPRCGRARPA